MKYSLWNPTEQAPRNVVECQEVVVFKCNAMMIEGYSTHEVSKSSAHETAFLGVQRLTIAVLLRCEKR